MGIPVGTAWFDDSANGVGGYAYIDGDVSKVASVAQLSRHAVFATNIRYQNHRKLGLFRQGGVLASTVFRADLALLQRELVAGADSEATAKVMGEVVSRALGVLKEDAGDLGLENSGRFIAPAVAVHWLTPGAVLNAQAAPQAVEAVGQSLQNTQGIYRGSAQFESFVFPRAPMTKWLIDRPLPITGEFEFIEAPKLQVVYGRANGKVEVESSRYLTSLLAKAEEGCAVFVELNVIDTDARYSFATFGMGFRQPIRGWALLAEVLEQMRFSTLKIGNAVVTRMERLAALPKCLSANEYSFSRSLAADEILSGLYYKEKGKGANVVDVYLKMLQRMYFGRLAEALMEVGIDVGQYSNHRLTVALKPGQREKAVAECARLGLIAPMGLLSGLRLTSSITRRYLFDDSHPDNPVASMKPLESALDSDLIYSFYRKGVELGQYNTSLIMRLDRIVDIAAADPKKGIAELKVISQGLGMD